jgi:SAM-dependent methyltransferase
MEILSFRTLARLSGRTLDYSLTALRRYIDPQYQRVCATAEALPFSDNLFRFVYSVSCLEHVPCADRAFEEIDRVLKPGGIAYLHPAWHCAQYNCEGIPVRPYAELTACQKLVKLGLPLRRHVIVKAAAALPKRIVRRLCWSFSKRPVRLQFKPLRPDYARFWMSDSDAASRLDSHEGCLFFLSRGYTIIHPGPGALRQLLARHEPLIVRKPCPVLHPGSGH